MTVQEAKANIENLEKHYRNAKKGTALYEVLGVFVILEDLCVAVECMEEVEQYRALGTVEELKEAREKQVAKKPIGKYTDYKCSVCGRRVRSGKGSSSRQRDNFCQKCGTKIDWEEGGTSE